MMEETAGNPDTAKPEQKQEDLNIEGVIDEDFLGELMQNFEVP